MKTEEKQFLTSQANISDTPIDQKSPGPQELGFLNFHRQTDRQTDIQTDGHHDSMTESAQWADSVKT